MHGAYLLNIVSATIAAMVVMAQHCQCGCPGLFTPAYYGATNRALKNHTFQQKTAAFSVICGRDCSMDPQCASFNYHAGSLVCELNAATRLQSRGEDFIELQESVFFDDNLDTPLSPVPLTKRYSSCQMLLTAGHCDNGIYTIYPAGMAGGGVEVYCDMVTDGGGWIVFQRRQDGSVDFYRNWTEYQTGFGDLESEFWLGNEALRTLTESGQWQLWVDLEDWLNNTAWARYDEFGISGPEYTLFVGSYNSSSPAGNALTDHDGYRFTTKDRDNDIYGPSNCAVYREGAWWFRSCFTSHLNGRYYHGYRSNARRQGILWKPWKGDEDSLKQCSMKIREVM